MSYQIPVARRIFRGRLSNVIRYGSFAVAIVAAVVGFVLMIAVSIWWMLLFVPAALATGVGTVDLLQHDHSLLRNYPIIGHGRYVLEAVRPEIQQYFIERDTDGMPFDRTTRSLVYARAKGDNAEQPFGTERDLYDVGSDWLIHSVQPVAPSDEPFRVRLGGPQCSQPYDIALLNVAAMSFGSLSANAVLALNGGAAKGGFAHDTGEGGLSKYHLEPGGDLVWEIGSGYFGCRTKDGGFDAEEFARKAAEPSVKAVSVKLSQGAKPGIGGVMPAAKMTEEIAEARGVPVGERCVSPPAHSAFSGPKGLLEFVADLRERSGGKPTGFKLCVGSRVEVLAICKAMLETGIVPDFIKVDGSEGGTGAGPVEFQDHMGMPLTDGLTIVRDALVGTGLRDQVKIGVSGKIASGADIVKRLAQGADFTSSARAMMMAIGCIQAQTCHTNMCPVGITTQDPKRTRALVVADKAERVYCFHHETTRSAQKMIGAMGLSGPDELRPHHVIVRTGSDTIGTFDDLYPCVEPGQFLSEPPESWATAWKMASADSFT